MKELYGEKITFREELQRRNIDLQNQIKERKKSLKERNDEMDKEKLKFNQLDKQKKESTEKILKLTQENEKKDKLLKELECKIKEETLKLSKINEECVEQDKIAKNSLNDNHEIEEKILKKEKLIENMKKKNK